MIPALECEHQAFAVFGIADDLQRILNCLRTADIEMHAAFGAERGFDPLADSGGQFDLFAVQILAGHLRQLIKLALDRIVQTLVFVAEIDGRIPHLQIQKGLSLSVVHIGAFAGLENFWFVDIVDRIAMRAIDIFQSQKLGIGHIVKSRSSPACGRIGW